MGTNIRFSTAFHPQTSGQVERVNQILEDMLRACVISFGMKWEDCLPYAEFSYNNSFQASSGKAPFEILYGRKCRTPLNWSETGERQLLGNDLITEAECRGESASSNTYGDRAPFLVRRGAEVARRVDRGDA